MKKFAYGEATSGAETIALLGPNTRPLAGGTDLLPVDERRHCCARHA